MAKKLNRKVRWNLYFDYLTISVKSDVLSKLRRVDTRTPFRDGAFEDFFYKSIEQYAADYQIPIRRLLGR